MKAEGKFVLSGDSAYRAQALAKAETKLAEAWAKAAQQGVCGGAFTPDDIEAEIAAFDAVALDCIVGGEVCDGIGRAWRAGVKIAFGTDAGVGPHGDNAKEFQYMVETGYPPIEAIRAATVHSAELLGVGDELGTLEAGKLADIIAVDGDPLEDVTILQDVRFVMKEGEVFLNDE